MRRHPWPGRSRWRRHLVGGLSALGGGLGTLGLLLALNAPPEQDGTTSREAAAAFEVPPPPKPPPRATQAPPKQARRRAAPPVPVLGGSLAGLDLGLDSQALLGGMAEGLLGDTEAVVMTEDAVDQPPRPLSRPPGPYPVRARARGVTGSVLLRVLVGADGRVAKVQVEDASPRGTFEEAAEETVRAWIFEPGRYRGTPVPTWIRVPLRYELDG